MKTALITGGSRGLGRAVAHALNADGWKVTITGRDPDSLRLAVSEIGGGTRGVAGDIADSIHRQHLLEIVGGRLDLLMNNASTLGPTPLRSLTRVDSHELERVFEVNVHAPLRLAALAVPALSDVRGTVVNVSSDAAVEPYEGWGVYGASKAALDQATRVLAEEHPDVSWYAFDPGDMRTDMHQAAFPGEDISDRPDPAEVVPALLALLRQRPSSGRYRAAELLAGMMS